LGLDAHLVISPLVAYRLHDVQSDETLRLDAFSDLLLDRKSTRLNSSHEQ